MGRASRQKGQRGEREAAHLLTSLGLPSKRAGYSGHSCEDIEHTIDGVHLEVKYQARPNIRQAMMQATMGALYMAGSNVVNGNPFFSQHCSLTPGSALGISRTRPTFDSCGRNT